MMGLAILINYNSQKILDLEILGNYFKIRHFGSEHNMQFDMNKGVQYSRDFTLVSSRSLEFGSIVRNYQIEKYWEFLV